MTLPDAKTPGGIPLSDTVTSTKPRPSFLFGTLEPDLRAGLEAIVYSSLRPVAAALGILYAVFAVSHWYVLPPAAAVPMTVLATLSVLALFLLRSLIIRYPLPITYASPLGAAIAAVVLVNCFAHLVLVPDPHHTTNLVLAVVGAGCFFLSSGWFALVLAIALGGWGLIVWTAPPSPTWLHFGFALFAATVIAILFHYVRVQTYLRLERLHKHDIARQQQLETALAASKEVERIKDELISTVNHELRTPLASLRGFTELLLTRDFPPQKQKEIFTILQTESLRLTRLVDNFLDLQRMESARQSYQFIEIALGPFIRESMAVFVSENGKHAWSTDIPDTLPLVRADADRIRQVLANLLSNAMKFSTTGGTISVGARQQDTTVLVWIADTGIGIPPEALPRLFEKFFRVENDDTRRIGGTGLGLALVKKIVEEHHGKVWVKSTPNQGSTFFFTLPTVTNNP